MVDNKEVMDWANSLCTQALAEARDGNAALANRVGANVSLGKFFNMVHGQGAVKAHDFPAYYIADWKEITRLYEAYLADEEKAETLNKVSTLEARFDKLESMLTAFIESQKPAAEVEAEEPAPAKSKGGKKAAKTEVGDTTEGVKIEDDTETPVEEAEAEE